MDGTFDRFGIDPIGTAGHYEALILVEWPLPWPRDIFDDEALIRVAERMARAGDQGRPTRVLAAVPASGEAAVEGRRRVIAYRRGGEAGPYRRAEALVATDELVSTLCEVIDGADPAPVHDPGPVRDLVICTHGKRDTRCGAQGMRLFEAVSDQPGLRVWRVSHIGGHRFAPTGISFPEGWFWSNLDADTVAAVVGRRGDPAELAHHLRGNGALAPAAQVVDRLGFVAEGWSWLDEKRSVEQVMVAEGVEEVRVGSYRGRVGIRRQVPTVACDSACEDPSALTPEWGLV